MFNLIFTKTSFNGVHSIKRHYKYIVDSKNKEQEDKKQENDDGTKKEKTEDKIKSKK